MSSFHQQVVKAKQQGLKQTAILIDPDKVNQETFTDLIDKVNNSTVDYIFVGGSLLMDNCLSKVINTIKEKSDKPVIIFPGSNWHVDEQADALLLLSLISGRNADLLIGKHVEAAPILAKKNIEIVSTGYILIDGGKATTVSYISNTNPIPNDKPEIAMATALAGEMIGMKLMYLDAGSGASTPVSSDVIKAVSTHCKTPVIVGGGIKTKEGIKAAHDAGADIVVVGNHIERNPDFIINL